MVAVGAPFALEYEAKVWYYDPSDPARTPRRTSAENDQDRLFYWNPHIFRGPFFFPPAASWKQVVDRQQRRLVLVRPNDQLLMMLCWGGLPWLALLFGYFPAERVLAWFVRRASDVSRGGISGPAVPTVLSIAAPVFGVALWGWVGTGALSCLLQLASSAEKVIDMLTLGATMLSVALWLVASVLIWRMLIIQDRARKAFRHRLWIWPVLSILMLGGPAAGVWLVGTVMDLVT